MPGRELGRSLRHFLQLLSPPKLHFKIRFVVLYFTCFYFLLLFNYMCQIYFLIYPFIFSSNSQLIKMCKIVQGIGSYSLNYINNGIVCVIALWVAQPLSSAILMSGSGNDNDVTNQSINHALGIRSILVTWVINFAPKKLMYLMSFDLLLIHVLDLVSN